MIEIFEEDDIPVKINGVWSDGVWSDGVWSDEFFLNTIRVCIFFSNNIEKKWWIESRLNIINNFVKENSSFNCFKDWSIFFFNVIPRMTSAEVQRNKKRLGSLDNIYKFIPLFEQYINSKFKKRKTNVFEEIKL